MKNKTLKQYQTGDIKITQDVLSLKAGKKVLALLEDLDWEEMMSGEMSAPELVNNYILNGTIEKLIPLVVVGLPKDYDIEDLSMELILEIVNDFFELNVSLIRSVASLLASLVSSRKPDQVSEKPEEQKSSDSTSGPKADSDSTSK